MKVNPLLIPYFLEMGSESASHLLRGTSRSSSCFWKDIQSEVCGQNLEPRKVEDQFFSGRSLYIVDRIYNEKMKNLFIGKTIDHFIDAPLCHRTEIQTFSGNGMLYKTIDPYVDYKDIPIHTKDSYAARMRRKAVEILLCTKLNWITHELIDRMTFEQIGIVFECCLKEGYGTTIEWQKNHPSDILQRVEIDNRGYAKNVVFGQSEMQIRNGRITINSVLPQTTANALKGENGKRILDHWLLEKGNVANVTPRVNTTTINIKGKAKRSYLEENPQRAA